MTAARRISRRPFRTHLLLLLAYGLVGGACPVTRVLAAATWYHEYAKGVEAARARQWPLVETQMKAALRGRPSSGRAVRTYGMVFIDYLPHYYLGVAYFHQGKYADALEELRSVEEGGLVKKADPEYRQLSELIESARARVAASAASPAPSAQALAVPAPSEPTPPSVAPQPTEAQREAETLLRHARDLLAQGQLGPARRALDSARAKDASAAGLPEIEQALARKEVDIETTETVAQLLAARKYKDVKALAAGLRAGGHSDARLDDLVARADRGSALEELSRLVASRSWVSAQERVAELLAQYPKDAEVLRMQRLVERQLAGLGGGQLEEVGVRSFYAGRYESAVSILQQFIRTGQSSATAHFYLGCSNAALGFLKGDGGDSLLEEAQRQFSLAKRLHVQLGRSEERLISPRITQLFRETR